MAVDQYPRLDLRHIVSIVQRRLWLIVGLTVLVPVLVFVLSSARTSQYETFSDVNTSNPDLMGIPGGGNARSESAERRMATEVYQVRSAAVEQVVQETLGPRYDDLTSVSAEAIESTDVVRITVASPSPELSKEAADAYADSYVRTRRSQFQQALNRSIADLEERTAETQDRLTEIADLIGEVTDPGTLQALTIEQTTLQASLNDQQQRVSDLRVDSDARGAAVSVARNAEVPTSPYAPTPVADAVIAALVVLLLTIGIAFLLDQLDNRVKTAEDVARLADGLPVIGSIPVYHSSRFTPKRFQHSERTLVNPSSTAAEAYRVLATSLRFSSLGKEKRTILVTSSFGGEGKTTVTANLAAMLAESGLRVVVVSADLRRPQLGSLLGISETDEGLTSAMLGDSDLSTCFVPVALPSGKNLYVLPAGPLPHEPAVLLGSDAFGEMLEEIKEAGADFILIDCAPVLPVSDPLAAARHVDGVLLLTLAEKTKQASFQTAVERLRKVNAEIIGVVLNGVGTKGSPYAYQYYGHDAYNRLDEKPSAKPAPPGPDDTSASSASSGLGRPRT